MLNPVVDEVIKQYEDQQSALQSMIHMQAHYIEEMISQSAILPFRIQSKSEI